MIICKVEPVAGQREQVSYFYDIIQGRSVSLSIWNWINRKYFIISHSEIEIIGFPEAS